MNKTNTTAAPTVFPDGEFTIKDLMAASGKSQPLTYLGVKKAISNNLVKEIRREVRGKGRPTAIYSKI